VVAPKLQSLKPGQKIRVLVVDDSVVIRRLVCHALEEDPLIEVVGVASNGSIALNRIPQLNPDVLTLDIEMPEMDGLEMLRHLRPNHPDTRVVMFSTLTERGAEATLEALSLGADDYVTKASNAGALDVSLANLRSQLIPKIHQFFIPQPTPLTVSGGSASAAAALSTGPRSVPAACGKRPEILVIGISTGGPSALATVIPQLPADFPLPVLIVQHMPPLFTRLLAERLNGASSLEVQEGKAGDPVEPGHVYIAPGDFHMKVVSGKNGRELALDQSEAMNSCRPAVDALFLSAAEQYGGAVLGAVLTGMGHDGLRGAQILKGQGAYMLAQDEASSVVWGMPGALVKAGLANEVVPLEQIAATLVRRSEG
jgi:two-component system chemotaxis response regulator CheB